MIPGAKVTAAGVFPRERPCYLCTRPGIQTEQGAPPVCVRCRRDHLTDSEPN
jgi:hypothetical protein